MKQSLTSARRPLEALIHIIGWGIMFGFPFFFVEREKRKTSTGGILTPFCRTVVFHDRVLRQLLPAGSPISFSVARTKEIYTYNILCCVSSV